MKVLIIEDEIPAASRLARMLQDLNTGIRVIATLDSVESSVAWLREAQADAVELVFMDIQLADGLSFSIFQQVDLKTPVIFTTAFDNYYGYPTGGWAQLFDLSAGGSEDTGDLYNGFRQLHAQGL